MSKHKNKPGNQRPGAIPSAIDQQRRAQTALPPTGGANAARQGAPATAAAAPPPPPAPQGPPGRNVLLSPRSPLVFGTGQPDTFGMGGASLRFPNPSTVAGALRAAVFDGNPFAQLAQYTVGPPLLVHLHGTAPSHVAQVWLPKPADALQLDGQVQPLLPGRWPAGALTDLSVQHPGLRPLQLKQPNNAKPDRADPWWSDRRLLEWLRAPQAWNPGEVRKAKRMDTRAALELSERTHVVIDPVGKGAVSGGLFRTAGLDFGDSEGLWVDTDLPLEPAFIRRLGGEGRFVLARRPPECDLLALPPDLGKALEQASLVRLYLVSPAVFEQGGWRPDWLQADANGRLHGAPPWNRQLQVELVAVALERTASFSGWQPANEQDWRRAGPGRAWRAVPAGSVYWFALETGSARQFWRKSLCTGQWAQNGWGHALVGTGPSIEQP